MQGRKAGPSVAAFIIFISFILSTGVLPSCILPIRDRMFSDIRYSSAILDSSRIRVLNWNIEKKGNDLSWHLDFTSIRNGFSPDLLILQEAALTTGMKKTLSVCNLGWFLAPNLLDPSDQTYAGVLTASAAMPVSGTPVVSSSVEPFVNTPKAVLATEFEIEGHPERLLVVNVHAINFVEIIKYESQMNEIEEIISSHAGPVILSGDFNTWNGNRIERLNAMARRLALVEVKFSPQDSGTLLRFPFFLPLDHIFYRGLTLVEGSPDVLESIRSSDHFPMVVEFSLPQERVYKP